MKRIFLSAAGFFLILLGMIGLIVPVMPGWIFIFMGLSLVVPEAAERLKRGLLRLRGQSPKTGTVPIIYLWRDGPVTAGFTNRHFPLFLKKTDDLLDGANQEQLRKLMPGKRFVFLNQVHGDNIVILSPEGPKNLCLDPSAPAAPQDDVQPLRGFRMTDEKAFIHLPATDAVLTNIPGLTLLVLTADCLSIFLRAEEWIGLVHAGWRGTRGRIAAGALRLLMEKSGVAASQIRVAFGPRICEEHYEVDSGKSHFDLAGENKKQLTEAGVLPQNIFDPAICTFSEDRNFYSFRREGEKAGRMISFILRAGVVQSGES